MLRLKFHNTYSELQNLVRLTGIDGHWTKIKSLRQFQGHNGVYINFWPSTETVQFQGRRGLAEAFQWALLGVARTEGSDDFRQVLPGYPMNDGRTSMTHEFQRRVFLPDDLSVRESPKSEG